MRLVLFDAESALFGELVKSGIQRLARFVDECPAKFFKNLLRMLCRTNLALELDDFEVDAICSDMGREDDLKRIDVITELHRGSRIRRLRVGLT